MNANINDLITASRLSYKQHAEDLMTFYFHCSENNIDTYPYDKLFEEWCAARRAKEADDAAHNI